MRSRLFATVAIAFLSAAMLLPRISPGVGIHSGARAAPPPVSAVTPGSIADYPDTLGGTSFADRPWERGQEVELAGVPSPAGNAATQWDIQCADCPKRFWGMSDRSLRLDAAGHPHVVYGADHLYYAWHDGASWHYETVDGSPGVGQYACLALDGDGHPHITYSGNGLKYARWTGSAWNIETVDSDGGAGPWPWIATGTLTSPTGAART